MTMMLSSPKDWSARLAHAGGANALVERVIAVLEHGSSVYKLDKDLYYPKLLESLFLNLRILVDITEGMAASMQSRSVLFKEACERADLVIGHCNDHLRDLQATCDIIEARIKEGHGAAADDLKKFRELREVIAENDRKIAEVKVNLVQLAAFWWVPGYNWNFAGKCIDDAVYKRQSLLANRLREAENERMSTVEQRQSQEALVIELKAEMSAMPNKIEALEHSKTRFEESSKLYAAKVKTLSNAGTFYGHLSDAFKEKENLDLPKTIERLYESNDQVLITGEVRRESLKKILIQLGGDYDRFLEYEGLMKPVNISFRLFYINDPLDPAYRLATVQEVTDQRDALFKAMPSWEIANLADGSVVGRCHGGFVRRQFRGDGGHKLGISTY